MRLTTLVFLRKQFGRVSITEYAEQEKSFGINEGGFGQTAYLSAWAVGRVGLVAIRPLREFFVPAHQLLRLKESGVWIVRDRS